MNRKRLPTEVETLVITKSKRRCSLCYGLDNDLSEKQGQIAHLNKNRDDNRLDNLAWLCFPHHDRFDSTTSQSKNYTRNEIIEYRERLYSNNNFSKFDSHEIHKLRQYLSNYSGVFGYIQQMGGELAFSIEDDVRDELHNIVSGWSGNNLRCFSPEISSLQDKVVSVFADICNSYILSDYHATGNGIIFTWKEDQAHNNTLDTRKEVMRERIVQVLNLRIELQSIASAVV
jgi:hypothetical protein